MAQNWEVVGKGKPSTKTQKQLAADKMPKLDDVAEPLKVSKSMFDAFEEKPKATKNKKPLQDRSNNQSSPKANSKPKKSKKPAVTSKYSYKTLAEAIHDVSVVKVLEKAEEFRSRFPKNPNICLRDIAAYINDTISCPDENPAFLEREFGYPITKIPKPMYNMLQKLCVEEPTDAVKDLLFQHCIKAMLDCIATGQPTWGYRLCIQALAHSSPKVCISHLHKDIEKIQNMKNVPKSCLAYLWALGQVGVKDPQSGMTVFLKVMLPMIQTKSLAPFVVLYLESLITSTKDPVSRLSGSVDADHFLQIMKWSFDPSTGLASNLRERLCEQYRPLRLFATGNAKLKLLLFKKFLETSPEEIASVKTELLEIVFECMQANPQCFSHWREMYVTALPQTKILLEYLEENWVESLNKLPRKHFPDTIRAFHNTNVDAAAQSSPMTSAPEFKAVNEICKHMHVNLSEEYRRTLSRCQHVVVPLLVAVLAIGLGLFLYDVHTHGGAVERSATYRTLEDTGVLGFTRQIWAKIAMVLQQIIGWLQTNIPFYWVKVQESLGPHFAYLSTCLIDALKWMVAVTAPIRDQLSKLAEASLIMVDNLFSAALKASLDAYEVLRPYLLALGKWVVEKASAVYAFLSGDFHWCCVRDAVVDYVFFAYERAVDAYFHVCSYVVHLAKLAGDYISGENM